ncbi:MAG: molybdopterin-guanine dinucleotide biosynthesis protein B [Alphaproteobacteria bacterium]|nr:molybdopterin-guanine dinucleotide biosynthesis protein B [Alphaproteobacteria bacterium]
MKIIGLAGWSGSGKTTLVARLLPMLTARGLRVSTVKHAHHSFDMDKPGKDSHVHREAGATEVLVTSAHRWALLHENRGMPEPSMVDLIRYMTPVDLLIVEGFKAHPHDKIEIYRPANGKSLLARDDPHIVAVATDEVNAIDVAVPILDLNDVGAIAEFIIAHCGLREVRPHGPA